MTARAIRLRSFSGTKTDVQAIFEVLADTPSYSMAISGGLPSRDDAAAVFSSRPPSLPAEHKHVYGIYSGSQLVGMADVLRGYPAPEVAYVGLLVIRERFQGNGLGRSAEEQLCLLAREWGCKRLRLAVVEANADAAGFWMKCGFSDTGMRVPFACGTVRSQSIVFEKVLSAAP